MQTNASNLLINIKIFLSTAGPFIFGIIGGIINYKLSCKYHQRLVLQKRREIEQTLTQEKIVYVDIPNVLITGVLPIVFYSIVGVLMVCISINHGNFKQFISVARIIPGGIFSILFIIIFIFCTAVLPSFYSLIITNKRIFVNVPLFFGIGRYCNKEIKLSEVSKFSFKIINNSKIIECKMNDNSRFDIYPMMDAHECCKILRQYHSLERKITTS